MLKFITVTGRRLLVEAMTGDHEAMLLRAAKASQDGSNRAGNAALHQLMRGLIKESTPELTFDSEVSGEEFDILYLIRLASLGPLYEFSCACRYCLKSFDYKIDIRKLRRRPQIDITDEHDPVRALLDYDLDDVCRPNILTADFSSIPDVRAGSNPDLRFRLPVEDIEVICKLPMIRDNEKLEKWMEQEDPYMLSKQLAHMTLVLGGETDKAIIRRKYDKMESVDRFWLRDQLADAMPGVDTDIRITCQNKACRKQFPTKVDIAGNFFLPKRALLTDWYGSYRRSVRAIGDGQAMESWRFPS